jgi:hypothetical protein
MSDDPPAVVGVAPWALINAVRQVLVGDYAMKRPPDVTARLLAYIITLAETKAPFPSRKEAARLIGCTRWGIDAAMTSAKRRSLVQIRANLWVNQNGKLVRLRFVVPTDALLGSVRAILQPEEPPP